MTKGSLYLCFGPMFSGKTSWLVSNLTKLADLGFRCLLLGASIDTRILGKGQGVISSHNSGIRVISPLIDQLRIHSISDLSQSFLVNYDVLGIDEGQFIAEITRVTTLVDQGFTVYISALSGDFKRRPIGDCFLLIPHCEELFKLNAICTRCLEEHKQTNLTAIHAPFTIKKTEGSEQIEVGKDQYAPVCRTHFQEHNETIRVPKKTLIVKKVRIRDRRCYLLSWK